MPLPLQMAQPDCLAAPAAYSRRAFVGIVAMSRRLTLAARDNIWHLIGHQLNLFDTCCRRIGDVLLPGRCGHNSSHSSVRLTILPHCRHLERQQHPARHGLPPASEPRRLLRATVPRPPAISITMPWDCRWRFKSAIGCCSLTRLPRVLGSR